MASTIFGVNLKSIRMARGLSQGGLARIMGVNRASICQWETGAHIPRSDSLRALADSLNVDMATFFSTEEPLRIPYQKVMAS